MTASMNLALRVVTRTPEILTSRLGGKFADAAQRPSDVTTCSRGFARVIVLIMRRTHTSLSLLCSEVRSMCVGLLLIATLCASNAAHAAGSCSLSTAISPAFPNVATKNQTVGATIWSGNLITTYSCTGLPAIAGTVAGHALGGVTVSSTASTVMGNSSLSVSGSVTGLSFTSGSCSLGSGGVVDYAGIGTAFFVQSSGGSCTFTVTTSATIKAASSTLTGIIPAPTSNNYLSSAASAWIPGYFNSGGYAALSNAAQLAGMATPSITSSSTTGYNPATPVACTATPSTTSVPLPTVSRSSLATAGQWAGTTAFSLNFSACTSTSSGYLATLTWSYTSGGVAGVSTIANTGSASNVVTQILDATLTPVANGATQSVVVPAAGGAVSLPMYARYYAKGPAGAGTVVGTATFTLSYN